MNRKWVLLVGKCQVCGGGYMMEWWFWFISGGRGSSKLLWSDWNIKSAAFTTFASFSVHWCWPKNVTLLLSVQISIGVLDISWCSQVIMLAVYMCMYWHVSTRVTEVGQYKKLVMPRWDRNLVDSFSRCNVLHSNSPSPIRLPGSLCIWPSCFKSVNSPDHQRQAVK